MLKLILQIFSWMHRFRKRYSHPPVLPFLTPQTFQQNDPCAKDENRFHGSWTCLVGGVWRGLSGGVAEPSSDHHRQNLRVHSLGFSSTKHGILLYSSDTD